jgi:hypothetical protein
MLQHQRAAKCSRARRPGAAGHRRGPFDDPSATPNVARACLPDRAARGARASRCRSGPIRAAERRAGGTFFSSVIVRGPRAPSSHGRQTGTTPPAAAPAARRRGVSRGGPAVGFDRAGRRTRRSFRVKAVTRPALQLDIPTCHGSSGWPATRGGFEIQPSGRRRAPSWLRRAKAA